MERLEHIPCFVALFLFPLLSWAVISPSVPAVSSKAGPSATPVGCITLMLCFMRFRAIWAPCVFGKLPEDAHQFGITILLTFEICQCTVLYLRAFCTHGGGRHRGTWKHCFSLLFRFNLLHSKCPSGLVLTDTWAIPRQELAMRASTGRLKDGKYQPRGNQQGRKK